MPGTAPEPSSSHLASPSPLTAGVKLLGLSDIRALLTRLNKRPTKTLGQNFVHDPNSIRRIVQIAGVAQRRDRVVLEVGPGLGSLTLGLLETGAEVVAVEIDPVLAGELAATVVHQAPAVAANLTVVNEDAMRVPPERLTIRDSALPTALVANLPYNVAVPILLHLVETCESLEHGLILVQAEVAQRLAAQPGGRVYGSPSVKLAWYAHASRAGVVGRSVFWPTPNVDSELVRFVRREPPRVDGVTPDRELAFSLIDAAFAQRRKTLRAALSGWAGSGDAAETLLRAAGIDPAARGETLAVDDYARLAVAAGARL